MITQTPQLPVGDNPLFKEVVNVIRDKLWDPQGPCPTVQVWQYTDYRACIDGIVQRGPLIAWPDAMIDFILPAMLHTLQPDEGMSKRQLSVVAMLCTHILSLSADNHVVDVEEHGDSLGLHLQIGRPEKGNHKDRFLLIKDFCKPSVLQINDVDMSEYKVSMGRNPTDLLKV